MTTDTVALKDWITNNRIEMAVEYAATNPNTDATEEWSRNASHYKCTLMRREVTGKRYKAQKDGTAVVGKMTTYFSQGSAHRSDPTAEDVLDCLASDASLVDQNGFEGWCSELGYDTDSRRAEKTYRVCEHGAKRLLKFLGEDLYRKLLYKTERF